MGRPPINGVAMTPTETQRRWRAKRKARAVIVTVRDATLTRPIAQALAGIARRLGRSLSDAETRAIRDALLTFAPRAANAIHQAGKPPPRIKSRRLPYPVMTTVRLDSGRHEYFWAPDPLGKPPPPSAKKQAALWMEWRGITDPAKVPPWCRAMARADLFHLAHQAGLSIEECLAYGLGERGRVWTGLIWETTDDVGVMRDAERARMPPLIEDRESPIVNRRSRTRGA